MKEFDLIVIGAGPGGYVAAIRASQLGLKVAVVEKNKSLGGTCLNIGCIPSKALLESSEHYDFAKHSLKKHGVECPEVQLNLKQMMKRKNQIVSELTQGIEFLFKKNKITRFTSWAKLKSAQEVELESESLKAKNILLATGSQEIELPFAKFDGEFIVSSTEALSFSSVPKSLLVVGGGYIGLELGSVWKRLGSEVTVVEAHSRLCPSMDQEMSAQLLKSLKKQGMLFHLNTRLTQITGKEAQIQSTVPSSGGKTQTLKPDKILVCVGRKPFIEKLGLEELSLQTNSLGQIEVDQNFRTAQNNIFAIGDLIAGPMLAHKAEEEGVAVAEFIATGYGHVNYNSLPSVIYTYPEMASVGKTEEELQHKNQDYLKGSFPFMANGRAKALGLTRVLLKYWRIKKPIEF